MYISTLIKCNKKLEINFEQLVMECAREFEAEKSCLQMPDYLSGALGHDYRAKKLLEILEVIVCGSVGGFDSGQYSNEFGRVEQGKFNCDFDRLLWIWNKYTNFNENKKYKQFMDELVDFYSKKNKRKK